MPENEKIYPRYSIRKSRSGSGNWIIFKYMNSLSSFRLPIGAHKTWDDCVNLVFSAYDRFIDDSKHL